MKTMKVLKKQAVNPKKQSISGGSQEKLKKKGRKRKSVVYKSEKRAKVSKCRDNGMSDASDVSFSLDEEKTIPSDGKSDFDTNCIDEMSDNEAYFETSMNTSKSSSIVEEFFKDTSDEHFSDEEDDNPVVSMEGVESIRDSENSFTTENDSHDSIESLLDELIENSQSDEEPDSDTDMDYEIHKCDTDHVVILKYSQTIKILGYCDLKVLHGQINILGHPLNTSSLKRSIYSPKGTALLTLKNTLHFSDEIREMKDLVSKLSKHPKLKDLKVRKDSCVMLFSKKQDSTLNFIEQHISQWIVPKNSFGMITSPFPRVIINPKGSFNSIYIPKEWDKVVQNATANSKILICGGKGVGKSTFLRYAVNCLLLKYKTVRIVDLDPGQSEFSVPSTLSIITVVEPLLGVNYTHLKAAERSILSDISVNAEKFIECIQEIMKNDVYIENVPTIINTMGFIDDIAFDLLSSTIALLKPNQIVYIESGYKRKNFKFEMDKKTLKEHFKLFTPNLKLSFKFDIEKIPSPTDDNCGWTLQPRQMREMCILAYFGQNMTEHCDTLQDYRLPMIELDLWDVSITDRNNSIVPVEAAIANIVALCRLVNNMNSMFECFGWGVVRCLNSSTRKLILVTPEDKENVEKVTHLVVGCLGLPPSVYMNGEAVEGQIPYIFKSDLKDFAQMPKRTRIPFNSDKK